jgi:hypothetical protein
VVSVHTSVAGLGSSRTRALHAETIRSLPAYCRRDVVCAHLARLPGLWFLKLRLAVITDAGLASLSTLTGLQHVQLTLSCCNKITDAGLASLSTLTGLQQLDLSACDKITDAGLASLSTLTGLQQLDLSGCNKITDAGLVSLSALTGLQQLDLRSCDRIMDAGLASLWTLTGLQQLDLPDCEKITDAGLASLSTLSGLQELNLDPPQHHFFRMGMSGFWFSKRSARSRSTEGIPRYSKRYHLTLLGS